MLTAEQLQLARVAVSYMLVKVQDMTEVTLDELREMQCFAKVSIDQPILLNVTETNLLSLLAALWDEKPEPTLTEVLEELGTIKSALKEAGIGPTENPLKTNEPKAQGPKSQNDSRRQKGKKSGQPYSPRGEQI